MKPASVLTVDRAAALAAVAYRIAAWSAQQVDLDDGLTDRERAEAFAEDLGQRFAALVVGDAMAAGCWPTWTAGHQDVACAVRVLDEIPRGWTP